MKNIGVIGCGNILETYLGMVNFDCKDNEHLLIKLPYLEQIFTS